MLKFIVTTGIFEGTEFYGSFSNGRIINNETVGQSYPVSNCKLIDAYYGAYIGKTIITNVLVFNNNEKSFGLCRTNKKGNAIRGGRGGLGMFTIDELYNLLVLSNLPKIAV